MADEKLKEKYESLKFELPSFQDLDHEFEISSVEDKQIIRGIRKKICEKLELYTKMLEELIQPDTTFSSMYEVKDMSEDDKKEILSLFKKMMLFYKEGMKLNLNLGNEEDVKFINEFFSFWKEMKPKLISTIDKLKETWKKDDDEKLIQDYLG